MINVTVDNKLEILADCKKKFHPNIEVSLQQKKLCLEFASRIYDENDTNAVHATRAFGGSTQREKEEIFINTLQGKIAEYGFYNYFKDRVKLEAPDMNLWGQGIWEDTDFTVEYKNKSYDISIKSTKYFGNLLLLERARYDDKGRYLEPADGGKPKQYSWIFLIRVKGVSIKNPEQYDDNILDKIQVEVSGYISRKMFINAIKNQKIIYRDTIIGGQPLQVDNYWFCVSELLNPSPKKH